MWLLDQESERTLAIHPLMCNVQFLDMYLGTIM